MKEIEDILEYPGFIHFEAGSPVRVHMNAGDDQTGMRDHMDAGEAWRNLCKQKTLYENGWVPQKCGAHEIIEKRCHKCHNEASSVALCVALANRGNGLSIFS